MKTTLLQICFFMFTLTLCLILLFTIPFVINTIADRSVKNLNPKSNQDILNQQYQDCVKVKQYDKINECRSILE